MTKCADANMHEWLVCIATWQWMLPHFCILPVYTGCLWLWWREKVVYNKWQEGQEIRMKIFWSRLIPSVLIIPPFLSGKLPSERGLWNKMGRKMDGALVLWLLSKRTQGVECASQVEIGLVGCKRLNNMKARWLDANGQIYSDRFCLLIADMHCT